LFVGQKEQGRLEDTSDETDVADLVEQSQP
jgi:hypothetical protein